ncbi:MAG: hypothetical protein WBD51_16210 [Burkholderiaceae bacterium]
MIAAVRTLLFKDIQEHLVPVALLAAGSLLLLILMLIQTRASELSLNSMQVVRLAVITTLPLVAFILGNRLIVREYLNRTRLFVEALPVGSSLPLLVKYFTGFTLMLGLSGLLVLAATLGASAGDDIDARLAGLILLRTAGMATLFWSIAFCFSLCGHLRLVLYMVLITISYFILASPYLEENQIGPFALVDSDIFAYERDVTPWLDLAKTIGLSACFTICGFILALVNEGSVAERLAKPMSRRDLVAIALVVISSFTVMHTLERQWTKTPYVLSGETVLRNEAPPIAIRYEHAEHKKRGEAMMRRLSNLFSTMQQTIGLRDLPTVRIWLDQDMDPDELKLWTTDGVVIHANFSAYDSYENSILDTVVIHGIFQNLTANRAVFEPNHWVTDGVSHWWARKPLTGQQRISHDNEVIARAVIALERSPYPVDLIHNFQQLADSIGHLSAEALAFSALIYLEKTHGEESIHALARNFLASPVGDNTLGMVHDRLPSSASRFASITGVDWPDFMVNWRRWLSEQASQAGVAEFLDVVPKISGQINNRTDESGVRWIVGSYVPTAESQGDKPGPDAVCVLKHDRITAFDDEIWLNNDIRDEAPCTTAGAAHQLQSPYAPGERAYVVLQFEHPKWHWPIMLKSRRLTIQ